MINIPVRKKEQRKYENFTYQIVLSFFSLYVSLPITFPLLPSVVG